MNTLKLAKDKLLLLLFVRLRISLLTAMLLLSCSLHLTGATYYVDSKDGNDGYSGMAPAHQKGKEGPWRTLSKVNATRFSPGDKILFKRGSVWTDGPLEPLNGGAPGGAVTIRESVVGKAFSFGLVDPDDNNCLYFGAYGEGPKPKIDCQGGRGIILLHNYIIVENLHIDNGDNNVLWLAAEDGNFWINIFHVDVTNTRANAVRSSYGGGNIWLKGLYVYNYGVNGILLNGSKNNKLKGVLVEDCRVEDPETIEKEDAITCHRDKEENDLEGDVIIRNNTILHSGEDGIDITSGHNILLEGNDIRHSYSAGIYIVKDWVSTVEARGNFIYSNSISKGVGDLTIKVPNVWACNNVIAGTGHHCLHIGNTDNTKIWNNVIAPGKRTGNFIWFREGIGKLEFKNNIFDFSQTDQDINGEMAPGIAFDHNCYFGASPSQKIFDKKTFQELRAENPDFEPNGMWADPRFADAKKSAPEHFMPAADSPCLDKGADVPVIRDIRGAARPQGAGIDMGVYERGTTDCDTDPKVTSFPGSPCDDGDPTTIDDVYGADCRCAGRPGPCAGIGDADGDGICADVDCNDKDPGITYQPGDACDDGNPSTGGETIQDDCKCGGGSSGPMRACARINDSKDDAEEWLSGNVDLKSSDLELAEDPRQGYQMAGLRFNGLNIPQGAKVTGAYIQFTVDETHNGDPCELDIYGQASDDAAAFSGSKEDISARPRTKARVAWAPKAWQTAGEAEEAQQTPDISSIIREIVNRPGYIAGSSIVIFIEGLGARTAESYDGSPGKAPELCVEYTPGAAPAHDCPALQADIGDACDDGDPNTSGEYIQADCSCGGGKSTASLIRRCSRISNNEDDAEENASGAVSLYSSDLELVNDASESDQLIGMRFRELDIPPRAVISSAYLQFTVDETKNLDPAHLIIYGQAGDDTAVFSKSKNDISSRPRTKAKVSWQPPAWQAAGDAGEAQRTPDLSAVIQEIVNRPGYTAGSSIVLIIDGKGRRTAESRDGSPGKAPELCVEYRGGGFD